jgi:serine/threonine protein kinase
VHTACTLRAHSEHTAHAHATQACGTEMPPTVAASLTYGCSLSHVRLQACGTLDFMAPEMLADEPAYEAKADVWSAGVLVYMLLSGSHPFRGPSQCATEERIKVGQLPSDRPGEGLRGVSPEARAFVKALLVVQPGARLSAKAALGHPWLRLQRNNADAPLLDAEVPAKLKALVETGAAAESKVPERPPTAPQAHLPAQRFSLGPRGAPSLLASLLGVHEGRLLYGVRSGTHPPTQGHCL